MAPLLFGKTRSFAPSFAMETLIETSLSFLNDARNFSESRFADKVFTLPFSSQERAFIRRLVFVTGDDFLSSFCSENLR